MTKGFVRFIAGAVCPSCKKLDKIAISPDDNSIYCLNCDFKEHRPKAPNGTDLSTSNPKVFNLDDFRNKNS
ncbi:YheV family putative metal-binding protein [Gammaproteobacteria bacterium]|jgi:uncharacterized metal-binding protein (TIGR02443 family)|nr:YheV family putative metal-binding protein [Gammaproteobacteria bacterium]|tara:strand:+ start:673 stop:885 length:213 start_codon:yes stop_codon:yes gene_type:complete